MKFSTAFVASAIAAAAILPEQADAHAFLMLPKADITIPEKNFYAYVVDGNKVPPFSSYTTGDAERNGQGFVTNYKKLNPPSLKEFILKNQELAKGDTVKPGKYTAECGYSNPNAAPQPLPDHIEFGNYAVTSRSGIHPGPCEAWCDDEIVIPLEMDCRNILFKGIPYAKDKCVGKSRFTFYWLATHFAPFQVYIGCAPLQGAKPGAGAGGNGGNGGTVGGEAKNNTSPATAPKPAPGPAPVTPKPANPAPAPANPAPAPAAPAAGSKCNRRLN